MKKSYFISLIALLLSTFQLKAQEVASNNFLGENFSLEAALEIFRNSDSPEDFEKKLNEENAHINNLDLNDDGEIDYIRVFDEMEGDAHAIVLQAVLSENESQDVAVIAIEKTGKDEATLQIFGDEYLYAEHMIVEPFDVTTEQSTDEKGPNNSLKMTRVVVNVWFWNPVRFIYRPAYRPWRSPFYWSHYPRVWRPRRPVALQAHLGFVSVYRPRYRVVTTPRVVRARRIYTPRRTTSVIVRSNSRVAPRRAGSANKATVVRKRNANQTTGKRTVKTTRVQKNRQKKKVKKTKRGRRY